MTITELIMSIPPPPPILESDTSFEIVFHYDGAVVTHLDKEEE
jgi:hypothetical protein